MNVPDKFCVAGDHGKWGAELRGDIGDDFLSKNIDAGGKIIFCEPVHRVLDCKDRLCEISGAYGGEDGRSDGQDHGENDQLHPVEGKSCIGTDHIFNQKISVLTGVGDRDSNVDIDYMVIAF